MAVSNMPGRTPMVASLCFLLAVGATLCVGLGEKGSGPALSNLPDLDPQLSKHNRQLQETDAFLTSKMTEKLEIERARYMKKLNADYGTENVPVLFKHTNDDGTIVSVGRTMFNASPVSWDRLKRKVMIKILTAQIEQSKQPFIWATGGHSLAAGHGNLLNESYTAVMDTGITPFFDAVGLDFTARRYAMGSTPAGMEIASCMKEVFGVDVDFLSWDYGMTTGRMTYKSSMYFYRGAQLPNRPGFMGIEANREADVLVEMEDRGFATFRLDTKGLEHKIPDSSGKTEAELDQMPPFLRAFRCGKMLENGEPTCVDEKYTLLPNDDPCNERKGKTSWHPGWKWHALYGNYLILFWIELLDDALRAIREKGVGDPKNLLDSLRLQEQTQYQNMTSLGLLKDVVPDLEATDIPVEHLYRGQSACHTAKVPSDIRYQGILTESELKGGHHSYDKGMELKEAREKYEPDQLMQLTWDARLYDDKACTNYEIAIDHQDFFIVNNQGWSKLVLPNPTARSAYGINQPFQGFIAFCLAECRWGCPEGTVAMKDFDEGELVLMTVNGVAVTNYTKYGDRDCKFLKHPGGHKFQPDGDGRFDIRAKTTKSSDYTRFSSFVVW